MLEDDSSTHRRAHFCLRLTDEKPPVPGLPYSEDRTALGGCELSWLAPPSQPGIRQDQCRISCYSSAVDCGWMFTGCEVGMARTAHGISAAFELQKKRARREGEP